MGFVEKFKALRERFDAEGYVFPSIRAFRRLTNCEEEVEEVYRDDYYVHYRLRYNEYTLEYIDCYTSDAVTNIRLFKGDELVFYSGQE